MSERLLALVRHGQSEGNAKNVFTGWLDLPLTETGRAEARDAAARLADMGLTFGAAYTSTLSRAVESCRIVIDDLGLTSIAPVAHAALNERDYGDLAGLDKGVAAERWGEEQVHEWRRSYTLAPPGGESLRDTAARVLPFYIGDILPSVLRCEGVLVVAHGNSLRALVMALDRLTPEQIVKREFATGEILVYRLRPDATIASRHVSGA